ncbi:hypothetical protein MH928_17240 [Flavobacterium sp. WW92]|uniref:leucine-rich repeat domain-containing protein n=1 Tax=unclassified Flavobacterium TaxID=196869 RepID=UPI0022248C57|nr:MULTISPECIES: hypothetical protein [unclassified Flavobacterium]WDO13053.1 hypothetical protein MH928_17240 [Flavobacterium sp. WW92]
MSGIVIVPRNNGPQEPQSITWREQFLGYYADESSFMMLFTIFSSLTVASNENVILSLVRLSYNAETDVTRQYFERYKWAKGEGEFSPIGNVVIGTDIIFESSNLIASAADVNLANTVFRNLGNISADTAFVETINFDPEGLDLSDVTKTYLIQFGQDGKTHLYVFRGADSSQGFGIYGFGQKQCVEADFNKYSDSGELPDDGSTPAFQIKGEFANNTEALFAGLEAGDIYQLPASADITLLAVVTAVPEPPIMFIALTFDDIEERAANMGVTELENAAQWNAAINNWNTGEGNVNFTTCFVDGNSVQLGGNNEAATYLDLQEAGLTNIEISTLPNLEYVDISHNSIESEIYWSIYENLSTVIANNNLMKNMDVSANANLISLDCSFNDMRNLNIGTPSLEIFNCESNPLLGAIIGLDQCTGLVNVRAAVCSLGAFDGSALVALQELRIRNNQLVNLFLENSPDLTYLAANDNLINDIGPLSIIKDGVAINLRNNLLPEAEIATILNYLNDNGIMPASLDMNGTGNEAVTGANLVLYNDLLTDGVNVSCNI